MQLPSLLKFYTIYKPVLQDNLFYNGWCYKINHFTGGSSTFILAPLTVAPSVIPAPTITSFLNIYCPSSV